MIRAKIIDIPLGIIWIRCVTCFSKKQQRVVVVAAKCRTIDGPNQMAGSIDLEIDFYIDGRGRLTNSNFMRWNGSIQCIISTRICRINLSLRICSRLAISISFLVIDSRKSIGLVGRFCTLSTRKFGTYPVNIFWMTGCFNNDISTLANLYDE